MSPWSWFAGEPDMESYGLAEEASREAVIAAALKDLEPGDVFEIIEARSSDAKKYEGSDFIPFLRTRNHEVFTVSDDGRSASPTTPIKAETHE